jgi:hypothetical protein
MDVNVAWNLYSNMSWIGVLWLTKNLMLPFWEMHFWFAVVVILFLGKIIDLVHVSHMPPWKKSKNFKLNVIAGFEYGCAWILLFMLVCSVFPSSHISGVSVSERYPMGSLGLQYLRIFNSDLQENINLKTWTQRWIFLSCLKSKVTFFPTTLVVGQRP